MTSSTLKRKKVKHKFHCIVIKNERLVSRIEKKQKETEFHVQKLEKDNSKLDKKLQGMHMLLQVFKAEKTSMVEKFEMIQQVMHLIQGKLEP